MTLRRPYRLPAAEVVTSLSLTRDEREFIEREAASLNISRSAFWRLLVRSYRTGGLRLRPLRRKRSAYKGESDGH